MTFVRLTVTWRHYPKNKEPRDVRSGSQKAKSRLEIVMSSPPRIVLQNSKVAAPRIFRENKKRETITDAYILSRGAEIAGEFNARGSVPSRLYTEDAPTARRIFDHLCKTTFATQSIQLRTYRCTARTDAMGHKETFPVARSFCPDRPVSERSSC